MKALVAALLTVLSVQFYGCQVANPVITDPDTLDYGTALEPTFTVKIEGRLRAVLKDPDSAKVEYGEPYRAWLKTPWLASRENKGVVYGYTVPTRINAKNSYGGYTGFLPYNFFFRDNQLLAWKDERGIWHDLR